MPVLTTRLPAALAIATLAVALTAGTPARAQEGATREISHVAGNLYRVRSNFHYSALLVTDDGVLVTDPVNADAARWLKAQIAERWGKPVRYVVYSHDHADHISGGEVFADTASVVAHRDTRRNIIGEQRATAVPDITFTDSLTLHLGGQDVELMHVGRSHSNNGIVMHFAAERALFAVDFISVDRLPYRDLSDSWWPDWIDAVRRIEAMDFDILLPGHGPVGTHADVGEHRAYLEALYSAVLEAQREGLTLEQAKTQIRLEEFAHLGQHDAWLALNIEGVWRRVALQRRGN